MDPRVLLWDTVTRVPSEPWPAAESRSSGGTVRPDPDLHVLLFLRLAARGAEDVGESLPYPLHAVWRLAPPEDPNVIHSPRSSPTAGIPDRGGAPTEEVRSVELGTDGVVEMYGNAGVGTVHTVPMNGWGGRSEREHWGEAREELNPINESNHQRQPRGQ